MEIPCRICGKASEYIFTAPLLNRYQVKYYACNHCGLVQTEQPYWLAEAYAAPINLTDTGLVRRNLMAARSAAAIVFCLYNKRKKFLDYAGGYGLFTRLMRNYGFDFYTHDPYTDNLLAKGFEYNPADEIELVTTFESFEHFVEPLAEIEKILSISRNIFFSTQLIPDPAPKPGKWWYYGSEHGQHIAFYRKRTLEFIARKHNLHVCSLKGYHLLTEKKVSNPVFQLVAGAGRFGLDKAVQLFMKSKVMEDMNALKDVQVSDKQPVNP
ncbi:MAG TPA: class I SAM-dependent methyltransferase [Chitinophaga sp.]|uniref:class I SAM-dependent methyltransferase n=1 Tax=Chitinophaga sp. TaxID=1869181 RepID=UPI002BA916FB|nr:class I SAM-dependent methyltransferase [Chitinophaga sp.]HVI44176.1 class I SAM-dependent methyltransferase [Chitinophaga sp.]